MRNLIKFSTVFVVLFAMMICARGQVNLTNPKLQGTFNGGGNNITNVNTNSASYFVGNGSGLTGVAGSGGPASFATNANQTASIINVSGNYTVGSDTNLMLTTNIVYSVKTSLSNITLTFPPLITNSFWEENDGTGIVVSAAAAGCTFKIQSGTGNPVYQSSISNSYPMKVMEFGQLNSSNYYIRSENRTPADISALATTAAVNVVNAGTNTASFTNVMNFNGSTAVPSGLYMKRSTTNADSALLWYTLSNDPLGANHGDGEALDYGAGTPLGLVNGMAVGDFWVLAYDTFYQIDWGGYGIEPWNDGTWWLGLAGGAFSKNGQLDQLGYSGMTSYQMAELQVYDVRGASYTNAPIVSIFDVANSDGIGIESGSTYSDMLIFGRNGSAVNHFWNVARQGNGSLDWRWGTAGAGSAISSGQYQPGLDVSLFCAEGTTWPTVSSTNPGTLMLDIPFTTSHPLISSASGINFSGQAGVVNQIGLTNGEYESTFDEASNFTYANGAIVVTNWGGTNAGNVLIGALMVSNNIVFPNGTNSITVTVQLGGLFAGAILTNNAAGTVYVSTAVSTRYITNSSGQWTAHIGANVFTNSNNSPVSSNWYFGATPTNSVTVYLTSTNQYTSLASNAAPYLLGANNTNAILISTLYTNGPTRVSLQGSITLVSLLNSVSSVTFWHTNNGIGYAMPVSQGGSAETNTIPFYTEIGPSEPYQFVLSGTGWLTNMVANPTH